MTFKVLSVGDGEPKEIVADSYMQHGFFIEFIKETPGSWEVVERLMSGFIKRIEVKE